MKAFDVEERNIAYMLGNKKQYIIPRNQREYVWGEENIRDFWEDIFETIIIKEGKIDKKLDYFIGSCVIEENKSKSKEIFLIDGQQRFTTIVIFLSAICEKFKKLKEDKLYKATYEYIEFRDDYGNEYFVLKNDYLYPYFEESILSKTKRDIIPVSKQQKNVKFVFDFFKNELENLDISCIDIVEYLTAIRDQILELKIIEIVVKDEVDAYMVFEILNARGKELEIQDKIKNLCMKKLPSTHPTDYIKNSWDIIRTNIEIKEDDKNYFKNFINHYYTSRHGKNKYLKDMYRFTRNFLTPGNVEDFVEELKKKSVIYKKIIMPVPTIVSEMEYDILSFFKKNRIIQVRPILLSLNHNIELGKLKQLDYEKHLIIIYKFHSVYTVICKNQPNKVERIYNKYASKIYDNYTKKVFNEMVDEYKQILPDYEDFKIKFSEKKYSNKNKDFSKHKNAVKHIINSVESSHHGRGELKLNKYSVEHIVSDDGGDITSLIGNLLPLNGKINLKAKDKILEDKIIYYSRSEFEMVKIFLKYNGSKKEWGDKDIINRTNKLAKLCYENIWNI